MNRASDNDAYFFLRARGFSVSDAKRLSENQYWLFKKNVEVAEKEK